MPLIPLIYLQIHITINYFHHISIGTVDRILDSDLSYQSRENIIENHQFFTVCYQCTKDLWTLVNVFAFPVSIIVLWICVSSSQTIILVKTCMHVWSFLSLSLIWETYKRQSCPYNVVKGLHA